MSDTNFDNYWTEIKDEDKIYVSDFEKGRYISKTFKINERVTGDSFKISPKVEVRLTYIWEKNDLRGIKITKTGRKAQELSLSTYDFKMLLSTLKFFSEIDLRSISNRSIILDKSIIGASEEDLKRFLNTIVADPKAKSLLEAIPTLTPSFIQEIARRKKNINKFKILLNDKEAFQEYKRSNNIGKNEEVWQKFFTKNDWILGSDVINIADARTLDEHNQTDIPYKSIDGFLDIIELKLPDEKVWNSDDSISSNLSKAIMQCARYLYAAEKKSNDLEKYEELGCRIVKPRITLIFGRSNDWSSEQFRQFRLLNASFSNISIMTYDQVLERAKKIVGDYSE